MAIDMPISGSTTNEATRCTTPMDASAPSAPMGLCAPYMFSRLFSTKFTAAMPACTAKLARPSDKIRRTVSPCSGIMRRRRRMGTPFVRQKYHSTVAHEMAWPHTVASALPTTPMPMISTNSALNTVHATAPMIMVPSARFGAPAVRMKLFTPMPIHWKMKPRLMMRMNCMA